VRDGNGSRSFDTLLRYRGSAMAELWRALRALKALQAEAPDEMREDAPAPPAPPQDAPPIEPEARENPGEIEPAPPADEPRCSSAACPPPAGHAPCAHPCVRAHEATQECATMRHSCATYAPPSAGLLEPRTEHAMGDIGGRLERQDLEAGGRPRQPKAAWMAAAKTLPPPEQDPCEAGGVHGWTRQENVKGNG
jgi:hypothetical protein